MVFRIDESAGSGHALVMVGWPGAAWHLELVHDPGDVTPAAPAGEDLLVLYLGGGIDEDVIGRLVDAGGTRVACWFSRCGGCISALRRRGNPAIAVLTFAWAFAHYLIFAAVAALGAGLQVVIGTLTHSTRDVRS